MISVSWPMSWPMSWPIRSGRPHFHALLPAPALALFLAVALTPLAPTGPAHAIDRPLILGSGGNAVQIDLSVLDEITRDDMTGRRGATPPAPRQATPEHGLLPPPGHVPAVRRAEGLVSSAPPPSAAARPPATRAETRPETRPETRAEAPPPPRVAEPVRETAPVREAARPVAPPPPPSEAPARASLAPPPPPPPPAAPTQTRADTPPVTPAPREAVAEAPLADPPTRRVEVEPAQPRETVAALPPATAPATADRAFGVGSVHSLAFDAEATALDEESRVFLGSLSTAMLADPSLRLQLRAYADGTGRNVSQARRLSLSRALAVRAFLIDEGVGATRIDVRALGSEVPEGPGDRVDIEVMAR